MIFKHYIDSASGLRYMYDTLEILSACGRRELLASKLIIDKDALTVAYNDLREIYSFYKISKKDINSIENILNQMNDVKGSIDNLYNSNILDDIELYELKMLSFNSVKISKLLSKNGIKCIDIPNLLNVFNLLDPDKLEVPSFYVYDSYLPKLKEIRAKMNSFIVKKDNDSLKECELNEWAFLASEANKLEIQIRESLSKKLFVFANDLYIALKALSNLDILLAKAKQINKMGLCFPSASIDKITTFKGMFHPQIKETLNINNKEFTPIDITFGLHPLSIIGANMGGKTVVLKMLALCQLLFQFGFGVPASMAIIDIKDDVILSVGDNQNELAGLSSFAAEIKDIDNIIKRANKGERLLALIDEPARTTNPVEGNALVCSLIKLLSCKDLSLIITTHYRIKDDLCKRLKVKGFIDRKMNYALYEPVSGEVPHEAIDIARELGASEEWLSLTNRELNM